MWRRRRLTRFLVTAPPTALETTKPARVMVSGRETTWRTTVARPTRRPRRTVALKSSDDRSRAAAGSMCGSGRKLGAALAPTRGQDGAPGAGPHAGTEAVRAAAAPVTRLECALAHWDSPRCSVSSHALKRTGTAAYVSDPSTLRGTRAASKPCPARGLARPAGPPQSACRLRQMVVTSSRWTRQGDLFRAATSTNTG